MAPPDSLAPGYRWEAFRHWANLTILAVGGVAGAVHDPAWWLMTAGLQAGILWVVPDLPPFRMAVDKRYKVDRMLQERAYYLAELWGLYEPPEPALPWWKRLLVEAPPPDLDSRIHNRNSAACRDYLEMRDIVSKLGDLRNMPGVRISSNELERLEVITNGYLRLLISTRPLQAALDKTDVPALARTVQQLEAEMATADPAVKPALLERQRIARAQLERAPKLEATLDLLRSRAGDMVQQIRQMHATVLSNPAQDVHSMLDEMAGQQELMGDTIGRVAADQAVRELLAQSGPARVEEAEDKARAARAGKASSRERI